MKSALWAFAVLALVIGIFTLRVVVGGELEIAESTERLVQGDPRGAAEHARAAALFYAPGAPHIRVAYERLLALGKAAEAHRDKADALFAYHAVMAASSSTRWIVTPHADDARSAAKAIARIESTESRPPASSLEPAAVMEQRDLDALSRDTGPRIPWIVALAVSFVFWVGGAIAVALRAIDGTGRFHVRPALPGGLVAIVGLGVWASALYFA